MRMRIVAGRNADQFEHWRASFACTLDNAARGIRRGTASGEQCCKIHHSRSWLPNVRSARSGTFGNLARTDAMCLLVCRGATSSCYELRCPGPSRAAYAPAERRVGSLCNTRLQHHARSFYCAVVGVNEASCGPLPRVLSHRRALARPRRPIVHPGHRREQHQLPAPASSRQAALVSAADEVPRRSRMDESLTCVGDWNPARRRIDAPLRRVFSREV